MSQGIAACGDAQCRALLAPAAEQARPPRWAQQPKQPHQQEAVQGSQVTPLSVWEPLWQSADKLFPNRFQRMPASKNEHGRWNDIYVITYQTRAPQRVSHNNFLVMTQCTPRNARRRGRHCSAYGPPRAQAD